MVVNIRILGADKTLKKILLLSCFLILVPYVVLAATIHVPCGQPTIQEGVDAAVDGDTVLLSEGTYTGTGNFNIRFYGKSISIKSSGGAENCIVDCQGEGDGFRANSGVSGNTITLDGLTVKNASSDGVGLLATSSNVIVLNCFFIGNLGGAVHCQLNSSFTNCTFTSNSGGAVNNWSHDYFMSSFVSCTFNSNDGGAVNYETYTSFDSSFSNCTFESNRSSLGGAVNYMNYSDGSSPSSSFSNCVFTRNESTNSGGAVRFFSQIWSSDFNSSFTNCVFASNKAAKNGGAINVSPNSVTFHSVITNCTFTSNEAAENGGAICFSGDYINEIVRNCILWNNVSPNDSEIYDNDGSVQITYSDIKGGYEGEGNIDLDPFFIYPSGGDFRLLYNSPCIDSGTPENAPINDLNGNLRPMLSGYDMGAYEVQNISEGLTIDAFVTEPTTGGVPLTVDFTCIAHDTNDSITEYHWVFGDGNVATTVLNNTQHQYSIPGTFTATCTVVNSNDDNVLASTSIDVSNEHPIANAGADQIIPRNDVDLDGSDSDDPDGTISFWQWGLSHTENPENDRAISGQIVSVSNLAFGHYIVTLTVTDNFGAKDIDIMYLSVAASDLKYTQDDYDQANQESYDSGHLTGYNEGYSEGYDTGYSTGYSEGYSNGVATCPLQEDENGVKHLAGPLLIEDLGLLIIQ